MTTPTRLSTGFAQTLKEVPKEAELASHVLMLRAGLIRQVSAGLYIYLPQGLKAIRKVENIIREEMNAAGAEEVLMPTLQPDSLWRQTGRWDDMGPELMRLTDRSDREFVLGPTHEEVITDLAANTISSYRELPKNLYQIQTKFRDETRPRFGLMRAREFIMKDAYSFDRDETGCDESYWSMYRAYERIFTRCGLDFRPVAADTGVMGGKFSHEFMALATAGEEGIAVCDDTDFAANLEVCACVPSEPVQAAPDAPAVEKVSTPGKTTIEEVTTFLGCQATELVKTLLFTDGEKVLAILVRGDRDANPVKIGRELGALVELAPDQVVTQATGATVGFAGPVGLAPEVEVWADHEILTMTECVTGANETDAHLRHVVPGRDFNPARVGDFRWAVEGDRCPEHPEKQIRVVRGIEVGQVFKLGTKYSTALGASFQAENGTSQPSVMGCYGIGVTRTVAAIIEQHHDEKGICWPASVAPYDVTVLSLGAHLEGVRAATDQTVDALCATGLEVLYDDREERPGAKFKDAELFGTPIQVSVGKKSLERGVCEVTDRSSGEREDVPLGEVAAYVQKLHHEKMSALSV